MKWEYHTETTYSIDDVDGSDAFKELFNLVMGTFERLGREGWELVSVDNGIAYFKRAIKESRPLDYIEELYQVGQLSGYSRDKLLSLL